LERSLVAPGCGDGEDARKSVGLLEVDESDVCSFQNRPYSRQYSPTSSVCLQNLLRAKVDQQTLHLARDTKGSEERERERSE